MNLNVMTVRTDREGAWLRFQGDVNYATAPEIRHTLADLRAAGVAPRVLDLREVTLLSSIGIELLIECARQFDADSGPIVIANDNVDQVLNITGIASRFTIVRTEKEAEAAVA